MILADTSVWVDHFRTANVALQGLLETGQVLIHPFILGELALGSFRQRRKILGYLNELPETAVAEDAEILRFIELHGLHGSGIGYVDAALLASATLSGVTLWTLDKRLHAAAKTLRLAYR